MLYLISKKGKRREKKPTSTKTVLEKYNRGPKKDNRKKKKKKSVDKKDYNYGKK